MRGSANSALCQYHRATGMRMFYVSCATPNSGVQRAKLPPTLPRTQMLTIPNTGSSVTAQLGYDQKLFDEQGFYYYYMKELPKGVQ